MSNKVVCEYKKNIWGKWKAIKKKKNSWGLTHFYLDENYHYRVAYQQG